MARSKVCKYRYPAGVKKPNGKLKKDKTSQRVIRLIRKTRSCRTGRKLKNVSKKLSRKLRASLKKLSKKGKKRTTKRKTKRSKRRTCKYPKGSRKFYRKDGTLRKSKKAKSLRRKWRRTHSCRTGKRYKTKRGSKRGRKGSKKGKKLSKIGKIHSFGIKPTPLTSADRKWWASTLTDCTKMQKKKGCEKNTGCLWDSEYNFCYDKSRDITQQKPKVPLLPPRDDEVNLFDEFGADEATYWEKDPVTNEWVEKKKSGAFEMDLFGGGRRRRHYGW